MTKKMLSFLMLSLFSLSLFGCKGNMSDSYQNAQDFFRSVETLHHNISVLSANQSLSQIKTKDAAQFLKNSDMLPKEWLQKNPNYVDTHLPNSFPLKLKSEFGTPIELKFTEEGLLIELKIPMHDCKHITEALSLYVKTLTLNGTLIPRTVDGSAFNAASTICKSENNQLSFILST